MEALFGVSTTSLARVLAVLATLLIGGTGLLALRRRSLLKLGLRNSARRPLRSAVIVLGCMLGTVVIATAFATGDAMTSTVRSLVAGSTGQSDEVITAAQQDFTQLSRRDVGTLASGGGLPAVTTPYFPQSQLDALRQGTSNSRAIAGLLPAIAEQAPAADATTQVLRPNLALVGLPAELPAGFDPLRDSGGAVRSTGALAQDEVFVNQAAAGFLSTVPGRTLHLYLQPPGSPPATPPLAHDVSVQAVVSGGDLTGPQATIFLPLTAMQTLRGQPAMINQIFVANRCSGTACSRQAALDLRKVLVDPAAAESIRGALASSNGRSVLQRLISRRSGPGQVQARDLLNTAERGRVTDHLIYLLGDPQVAGTLRATAGGLPTRDGGRAGRALRSLNRLTVVEVKQSALDEANQYGSILTSSFLVLGLFSIAASLLLVFLVFVMLAAERRSEMGIARAIGLQRSHLVQSFLFEGMVYDLGSALLGVLAGIGVSALIVALVAHALSGYGIPVSHQIGVRSLVVAFCLGLIVTFVTVLISAWRVSRINIVAAIRGLPDDAQLERGLGDEAQAGWQALRALAGRGLRYPPSLVSAAPPCQGEGGALAPRCAASQEAGGALSPGFAASLGATEARWEPAARGTAGAAVGGLLALLIALSGRGIVPALAGIVLGVAGLANRSYLVFACGVTLLIIGGVLLLRWLLVLAEQPGERIERLSYSLAGLALAAFWAFPPKTFGGGRVHLTMSRVETFALAGVMMVLGAVWLLAYNLTGPLQLLLRGVSRGGSATAAVKMAVAYPLQHRFRTGMAVAMFALVVFTMVVAATMLESAHAAYVARERAPEGYDISATAPTQANLTDITAAIAGSSASKQDEFVAAGSEATISIDAIEPAGRDAGWRSLSVHLADDGLLRGTRLRLSGRAQGFASDGAVWDALLASPDMAVVAKGSLPYDQPAAGAVITGAVARATSFAPFALWLKGTSGAPVRLRVIGIVDDTTALPSGLLTRRDNVLSLADAPPVPTNFLFKSSAGRDPTQAALGLDLSFGLQGLQTTVVGEGLRNVETVRTLLNYLLEGFVGLGLISGIAALGVVSTRAVVERRQEIGMLRAIGLKRRWVQVSFLLENGLIALLGIGVGAALGLVLSRNVVAFLGVNIHDLQLVVPWPELALIAAIALVAAVASTGIAAWQAGRIDPAAALRYE